MSICRICLSSRPRKDVTELKSVENIEKQSCEEIMLFCLGIQVSPDSNVSTKLCVKCFNKIIEFYDFKTLAVRSNAYLESRDSQNLNKELLVSIEIKKEDSLEISDNDCLSEPLIEIKDECKEENKSDDELLCVFKEIKTQLVDFSEGKVSVKKKRGRPKKPPTIEESPKVCDECGKEVKNLREHLKLHLPKELRNYYKCELCDKLFASRNAKNKHIKRNHLCLKQQCHLCDKAVLNLNQHIMIIHKKDSLPFQCVPCGRRFISQQKLDVHVTMHTKDRPFECDICSTKFRNKLGVIMHKRQVHDKEKSHLCQFCSKTFFKKHHLQVHLRSHTKEKPYRCPDCGKHYTSSTTLKNHRLTHSTEKKFNCTLCDMSFSTPNYLRAHMISHTKEKRYPCQFCGVKFHRSDHRKRHEFTAHLRNATSAAT